MFRRVPDDLLDARPTATPASPELAGELQQALDALRAANVAEAVSLGFACGVAVCRVDLTGSNGNLDQTVEALLARLPKRFVASNVLAASAEQRALYVATDQNSLRVAPAGATEVVLPSR
jgi:hypothetical protein